MVLGSRNEARTGNPLLRENAMARSTAHPDHQCMSSEHIQKGTEVYGAGGKNIVEIDHLIIDKASGRVAYAVMALAVLLG